MDARCNEHAGGRRAARGDPQGHCLQGIRVRCPRRRDEPALPVRRGRHRRPARAGLHQGSRNCTTSRRPGPARGCRMPGCSITSGEKVSTLDLTGHGEFTVLTGIGGEGWVEAAEDGRQGVGHRDRRPCHRPAPALAGSYRRLGECPRNPRQRRPAGPPGPSRRLARARRWPPIRPPNCAGS